MFHFINLIYWECVKKNSRDNSNFLPQAPFSSHQPSQHRRHLPNYLVQIFPKVLCCRKALLSIYLPVSELRARHREGNPDCSSPDFWSPPPLLQVFSHSSMVEFEKPRSLSISGEHMLNSLRGRILW